MKKIIIFVLAFTAQFAVAASATVVMYATAAQPQLQKIGTLYFEDTRRGLLIKPNLRDLSPGLHGMHVHAIGSCADKGMAAGGHYDPQHTEKHLGPTADGHRGDLPALLVAKNGVATHTLIAPQLTVHALHGRAIIIHAGGDNYSDKPLPLGGGGARIACGVVDLKEQTNPELFKH